MANHKLVTIGNHTHRHAIATNLISIQFGAEFDASQLVFEEILGYRPTSFVFPNCDFSGSHLKVCENAGLKMALGCEEAKSTIEICIHISTDRAESDSELMTVFSLNGKCAIGSTSSIYRSVQRTLKCWHSARTRGAA